MKRAIEALEIGECPPEALHVWEWFRQLSARRTSSGFGLNPITYLDVDAWSRLRGIRPEVWELDGVFLLDSLYLVAMAPKVDPKAEGKTT